MSGGFEDLGLLPELVRATQDQGWLLPSDIQDEAIPLILGGGDVMAAAETGSGKTGAFALPAIQIAHEYRRTGRTAAIGVPADKPRPAKKARLEHTQLSMEDRSPMLAITPDGLSCQSRQERDWAGVRATKGVLMGKFYYEAVIRDEGLCRFGWSTASASLDLGTDRFGFGYGGTGRKSNNRVFDPYGEAFGKDDIIGCFADVSETGVEICFSKNGRALGTAFKLLKPIGALYPAICLKNGECFVNFGGGAAPFRTPPGGGFVGVDSPEAGEVVARGGLASAERRGSGSGPVVIVLTPARDLAEQTFKAFNDLARHVAGPSISASLVIGGDSKQSRPVSGPSDIVIATPGKLADFIESGKVGLGCVRLLILDEADRFTDPESLASVKNMHAKLRAAIVASGGADTRLQVCFFSATLHSPEIGKLSDALCHNPTWVDLKGVDSVPDTVHHVLVTVDPGSDRGWMREPRDSAFANVLTDGIHAKSHSAEAASTSATELSAENASLGLKMLKPVMARCLVDSLSMEQCLIFCRTNVDCDNLEAYFTAEGGGTKFRPGQEKGKENRYSCAVLGGMRSMDERRRNLEAFKAGDVRLLICTDVAARGLDIKELPYVINMTLPDEPENYIHRIGRVGRADRMGLAISLVSTSHKEKVWFHKCANRGKGCSDTRLAPAGCAIWYDEPALLVAVRQRLRLAASDCIPSMSVVREGVTTAGQLLPYVFSLPPSVTDSGVTYGEEKGVRAGTSAHVELIREQVKILAALEMQAQCGFIAMKTRYAAHSACS